MSPTWRRCAQSLVAGSSVAPIPEMHRPMNGYDRTPASRSHRIHRFVRYAFLTWACVSTLWLANSYRTQDVPPALLESTPSVSVEGSERGIAFRPATPSNASAVLFFCGSGVAPEAYVPLLRPLAEQGYTTFIVSLPLRFAPLESHKQAALARARSLIGENPAITHWVVSGHSLGAALAARFAADHRTLPLSLVLVGTTHPKEVDLSGLRIPVTKVYASNDGIAPAEKVLANRGLLPASTRWIAIAGGNHSRFGHYGQQMMDGEATIGREAQQDIVRNALLDALVAPSNAAP